VRSRNEISNSAGGLEKRDGPTHRSTLKLRYCGKLTIDKDDIVRYDDFRSKARVPRGLEHVFLSSQELEEDRLRQLL
jgi:hypothetical protein